MYQSGDPLLHLFPNQPEIKVFKNKLEKVNEREKKKQKQKTEKMNWNGGECSDRELEEIDLAK